MILVVLSMTIATKANVLTGILHDGSRDRAWSNPETEADELLFSYMKKQSLLLSQLAMIISAAESFVRAKVTYSVGPERYSFERLERQYGSSATCKATFRFDLPGLKRVFAAFRFPDVIVTRSRFSATGEEVFLYMLKRLSYPATLSTLAFDSKKIRVCDGGHCGVVEES